MTIQGLNLKKERMYSEEDLKKAFQDGQDNMDYSEMYGWSSKLTKQEWFEQFKKERVEESNTLDDLEDVISQVGYSQNSNKNIPCCDGYGCCECM